MNDAPVSDMLVLVRQDDLQRLLGDAYATDGPCQCQWCSLARRRCRAVAWPKVAGDWPEMEEQTHE